MVIDCRILKQTYFYKPYDHIEQSTNLTPKIRLKLSVLYLLNRRSEEHDYDYLINYVVTNLERNYFK